MYVERESTRERPVAHAALESECMVTATPCNIRPGISSKSQKSTSPTVPHQRTYVKVSKEHLAIDTLLYYDIPYEVDRVDPNYLIILREIKPKETKKLLKHTRRLRSRLVIEERRKEKDPRALRPSKSETTDPSAKLDVVKHILKTQEARKAFQSMSLDASIISEPTDRHTPPSRPLFERSPSPSPVLATGLRTGSSTLSLRGKRRGCGLNEAVRKSLVGDHNDTSMDRPTYGYAQRKSVASSDGNLAPVGTVAPPQQPKLVQTTFVRKLHSMLEDQSIQHLISWSSTNDSFMFSPSSDFSKVLRSYFEHTSISSFVRQLHTYGFYKVGDVFQTKSPDSPLWEFKHAKGFDLVGLREVNHSIQEHLPIRDDIGPTPSGNFSQGQLVKKEPLGTVEALGSGVKQLKEDDVLEAHQEKLIRLTTANSYTKNRHPHSSIERQEDSHRNRQDTSPPTGHALPELDSLIAGWQATLPCNTAERDSGFHESNTVDVPQLETPDPTSHEINDKLMSENNDPLILDHDITYDQVSICSSENYSINNAKLLATASREATASDSSGVGVVIKSGSNDHPFRFDHILRSPSPSNTDKTRESLLSSHEGSEDESDTSSTFHRNVGIQNALDSALHVVKGLMLQKLIGHALSEATDAPGNHGDSGRGPGATNESSSLQFASNTARNSGGKRARGGGRDPDDEGDDTSDEDDNSRPKKKGASHKIPQQRLKCPFYQRQPEKYTRAACRGPGFAEMAKLKDHLKRVHTHPWRCRRCHVEMSEEEEAAHLEMVNACAIRSAPLDDRIAPQTLQKLDFKKAPFVNARSTEEKWKRLYMMLFPADSEAETPSPYTHNALSSSLARALSEALEEELNGELARLFEPAVARMKARIPAIIERCRTNLANRTGSANEETTIRPLLAESSKSPCVTSEPGKLRRKKKSSALTQRLKNSSEVFLQPATTVRKQPQYVPVPQMTPCGSSEESEEKSTASASASMEHIAHADSLDYMRCLEPSENIIAVDDWGLYEPPSVPLHSGLDTMLDFGLPPTCVGIGEQDPVLRPYRNDPYLYGASAPFGIDGMQGWDTVVTLERKGVDGYPLPQEQRLQKERLSMHSTTDWHFAERDQF